MDSIHCQHSWKALSAAWQGRGGLVKDSLSPDVLMQHWEGAVCAEPLSIWLWGREEWLVQQALASLRSWLGLCSICWNPTARQLPVREPARLKVASEGLWKCWLLPRQGRHIPVNALFQLFAFTAPFQEREPSLFLTAVFNAKHMHKKCVFQSPWAGIVQKGGLILP